MESLWVRTGARLPGALAVRFVAVLLLLAASILATSAPVHAALGGRTDFQIDGNTAGPNDWDDPPPSLLDLVTLPDACGNGVLDPTTLSGKLDELDLASPQPKPGNVTASADLCRGWYALDIVQEANRSYSLVLYGAWQREDTKSATGGESTVFFPLVGPEPGNDDDYLVAFEFDDSAGGGEQVSLLAWDGSAWVEQPIPPESFEAAVDDETGPSFGEFALELSALGIVSPANCDAFELLYLFSRTGQLDSNAELQDFVGPLAMSIDPCAEMTITKETTPRTPVPPADFEVTVARESGGLVTQNPDATEVTETLTVPGSASVSLEGLVPAEDYTVTEVGTPEGWSLESVVCSALDPTTGERTDFDVTEGSTFPVVPGSQVSCVVSNVGPPTLTVVKAGLGEDSEFGFSVTESGESGEFDESFELGNVGSWSSGPLNPGEYEVTETLPTEPAGWTLRQIFCFGDDQAVVDVPGLSASVTLDPGERVVCTFLNLQETVEPPPATLTIVKDATDADGTAFPIDVEGMGAPESPVVLTPPDSSSVVLEVTPEEGGSTYTITEQVPEGWEAVGTTCEVDGSGGFAPGDRPAAVVIEPGQEAVCVVRNAPIPPATLTVVKGGLGEDSDFDFSVTGPGTDESFVLGNVGSWSSGPLDPGDYVVSETLPTSPEGWELRTIVCLGSGDSTADVASGSATVTLDPGESEVCTFINVQEEPPPATLTIVKAVEDPDGTTTFPIGVTGLDEGPSQVLLTPPDPGSVVLEVSPEAGGSEYTLTESVPEGWEAVASSCQVGGEVTAGPPGGPLTVQLQPGDDAVCVFANEPVPPASLTVVKAGLGEDAEFDFSVTGPGTDESFPLGNVGSWNSGPLDPGDYVVTEALPTEPPGWELLQIVCFGDDQALVDVPGGTASVTLDPGERVLCTFLNIQDVPPATLTIVKEVPAADGSTFAFDVTGPGVEQSPVTLTPPDPSSVVLEVTPETGGSDYTVAEVVPDGWEATATSCQVGTDVVGGNPGGPVTVTVAPGEDAICAFANEPVLPPPASLTVAKVTQPTDTLPAGSDGFDFRISGPGGIGEVALTDGDSLGLDSLAPGTYTVTEEVPEGWGVTISCTGADAVIQGVGRVQVELAAGDDATCTFTNVLLGRVTVVKEADPMGDQLFPFDASYQKARYAQFTLDDDGDTLHDPETGQYSNTQVAVGLIPGMYSLSESVPEGWTVESITCDGIEPEIVNLETGFVSGPVEPGTDATCVYRNVQEAGPEPPVPPEPPIPPPPELPDTGAGDTVALLLTGLVLLAAGGVALRVAR